MNKIRLIGRLDIKGPNLIKGIRFEGLRVLGDPENFAVNYYNQGIDELIYIDTVASLYGRNNLLEFVKKIGKKSSHLLLWVVVLDHLMMQKNS